MNILLWYSFNEVLKGNGKLIKFFVSLFLYILNKFQHIIVETFLYFLQGGLRFNGKILKFFIFNIDLVFVTKVLMGK